MTNKKESMEQALNEILIQALAAYILLRAKEPVFIVMQDLLDIELKAAAIVDAYYAEHAHKEGRLHLDSILASTFSYLNKSPAQIKD